MRLSAVTMMFMPEIKGEHIRSIAMKNLAVWIVLICTAAFGVAVAQPNTDLALHTLVATETNA